MKFMLLLSICSLTHTECTTPMAYPIYFKDWNDCITEAYKLSTNVLKSFEVSKINERKIVPQFNCKEV